MQAKFDLLAGQQLGSTSPQYDVDESEKLLVWNRLETEGFQPSARTGHTSVTVGYGAVVFGGVEAGQRVNSSFYLDAVNNSWAVLPCKGDLPSPRCFHGACAFDDLMIVHGGEGPINFKETVPNPLQDDSLSTAADLATEKPKYRSSAALAGICPGDNIQGSKFGPNAIKNNISKALSDAHEPTAIGSLDDLHALDCSTLTWVKVPCTLAPLPRKGHTINVCMVYGKRSLIVMGGYSLETAVVSNSVLLCETEHISKCVQHAIKHSQKPLGSASAEELVSPAVWRSVQCKGAAPCGRYRHSATVVSTDREELLIIIGGIGKDPSTSLSDVHILNLGSLTWMQMKGTPAGLSSNTQLRSAAGPAMGVFGHVAFPICKPRNVQTNDLLGAFVGCEDMEIIVFGGSSHPADIGSHGYHSLFAFDLATHEWHRLLTGPQFPSSRCFHSSNIIANWSPLHELPFAHHSSLQRNNSSGANVSQLKRTNSMTMGLVTNRSSGPEVDDDFYLDLSAFNNTSNAQANSTGSVMIFGGMSINKATSETWVLDLQWRSAGLDQFDDTMAMRLQNEMNETYNNSAQLVRSIASPVEPPLSRVPFSATDIGITTGGTSRIVSANNAKYLNGSAAASTRMKASQSEPRFSTPATPINHDPPSKTNKMKLIQHLSSSSYQQEADSPGRTDDDQDQAAVLKIRKERALADMQLKEEKERFAASERRALDLQFELEGVKMVQAAELTSKDQEIYKLKELLGQSIERERKLMALNAEAYQLLGLYGIQHL